MIGTWKGPDAACMLESTRPRGAIDVVKEDRHLGTLSRLNTLVTIITLVR